MQINVTINVEAPQILKDLAKLILSAAQPDEAPREGEMVLHAEDARTLMRTAEHPAAAFTVKGEDLVAATMKKAVAETEKEEETPSVDIPVEEPKGVAPLTLADAKAAMNAARERIEGKDYQDSTTEGHKRYHRDLTKKMKELMSRANPDAMKPAELTPPQLAAFIQTVNSLDLDKDGQIFEALPF